MALGKLPDADLEGGEEQIFAEINITPLTDIFLVLLIIFMVGSTINAKKMQEQVEQTQSQGIKVSLPEGKATEVDPGRTSIVVSIQPSGQVVIGNTPYNDEQLTALFQSSFTRDKDTQVVLRADTGVRHGRVVAVMEQAKRVGLHRLAIATAGGAAPAP